MDRETAGRILNKLAAMDVQNVKFTGGTPEMNPNLPLFIEELTGTGKAATVRTSLTVLADQYLFDILLVCVIIMLSARYSF